MRKVIEYTIVSADGVWSQPFALNGRAHQDAAYLRDGLGQLQACEAMLMGRNTYEAFAKIWPDGSGPHPWGRRIVEMKKYVFSSRLDHVEWPNCELVRGDVVEAVSKLKQDDGADLLIYGHGLLAQTLLAGRLLDVLDVSIYPVLLGEGESLGIRDRHVELKLVGTRTFADIVKVSYEPQYR